MAREWVRRVREVRAAASAHRLSLISAAVAFYGFLSIFPGLAAVVSLYGLVADPATIDRQAGALSDLLPGSAVRVLREELTRIVSGRQQSLSLALMVGLGAALWSAHRGMSSLCQALNIVYGVEERRGFLRRTAISLALTVAGVLLVALTAAVVTGLPDWIAHLTGSQGRWRWLEALLGWPTLAAAMLLGLSVVYRWGGHRPRTRWRAVTWGSALATASWLLGSWAFSFYLSRFGNFDRTYGSMAAIAILLTWIYLTAFVVLLGAQIDAVRAARPGPAPRGALTTAHAGSPSQGGDPASICFPSGSVR